MASLQSFKIVDSTLLEAARFASSPVEDAETKTKIAKALDEFGVDYLEVPFADVEIIAKLGLKSKILTNVDWTVESVDRAVEAGAGAVDLHLGSSEPVKEVIQHALSKNLEVRVSIEHSFDTNLVDLVSSAKAVDELGAHIILVSDPSGTATPRQADDVVSTLRGSVGCGIQVHFQNDNGSAVSNSQGALEVGATHISTSVLGIGQRNGITSLGSIMARMMPTSRDYVTSRYNLDTLKSLEELVAQNVNVNIPFSNPVTGFTAFNHKAGIHSKAVLNNASTYEILKPEDFGLTRTIQSFHRLTGWNAVKARVQELKIDMTDDQIKQLTAKVKQMADTRPLSVEESDEAIYSFHRELISQQG